MGDFDDLEDQIHKAVAHEAANTFEPIPCPNCKKITRVRADAVIAGGHKYMCKHCNTDIILEQRR